MIAAGALLVYAVLASTTGAQLLAGASWPLRAPAWGIWAWQALSTSAAIALVLAGLVVALPETPLGPVMAAGLRACSDALAEHYATPGGLPVAALVALASAAVVARFATLVLRELGQSAGLRRTQRDTLALVGTHRPEGFVLVDHATPLVYCLPGRRSTVVVTSAARDLLTPHQLDLVLAHERRHLQAHHHTALTLSGALSRTFGGFGVFGIAHQHICALAEMQADDAVGREPDRLDLAHALLSLAPAGPGGGAPAGTAAVATGRAAQRVHRLTQRPNRPRRVGILAATAGLAAFVAPLALALVPALEAAARDCCPTAYTHLDGLPDESPGPVVVDRDRLLEDVVQQRP